MARTIGKLTALRVERENKPGLHPDGGGLYLQVSASGAKSWLYRFSLRGKTRDNLRAGAGRHDDEGLVGDGRDCARSLRRADSLTADGRPDPAEPAPSLPAPPAARKRLARFADYASRLNG